MTVQKITRLGISLLFALAAHGCATQKVLLRSDLERISQLRVAWQSSPEIRKVSGGGTGAGILLGGVLGLGGIGLAMEAIEYSEGKKMRERLGLPDFSKLVMRQFVAQAAEQIPNWPKMIVEEAPIDEAPKHEPGYLLTFAVRSVSVRSYGAVGLSTYTIGELFDPDDNVLWRKEFRYSQSEAGRAKELDEMEADEGKLLKEEMDFAAETTAQDFIDHIKRKHSL